MAICRSAAQLDLRLEDLERLPRPDRVLLADPEAFETLSALNPHMLDEAGRLKPVDRERARRQWSDLRALYGELGLAVDVVPPLAGQPDLVFCANQALPIPGAALPDGRPRVVPSNMAHPERAGEVPHVVAFLESLGYLVEPLEGGPRLEGMGDGLWHPERRLLWAGCGPRSSPEAWQRIAERYDLPVLLLELTDERFYHLDTCLAWLDEHTCLWRPEALAPASRELVRALVPRTIEVDERDALERLAANAFCPDGRHVLLERGAARTCERLAAQGFEPREVDTGEFLKAGGSVFCMKLFHGPLPTARRPGAPAGEVRGVAAGPAQPESR